jgi:hypothetical protein
MDGSGVRPLTLATCERREKHRVWTPTHEKFAKRGESSSPEILIDHFHFKLREADAS